MPASSGPSSGAGAPGGGASQRTTFRPPWVKDGPQPIPMPSQPWTPVRRDSNTTGDQSSPVPFGPGMLRKTSQSQPSQDGGSSTTNPPASADPKANLRKTSKITIVPSQPQPQLQPQLQPQPQPQLQPAQTAKEVNVPITRESSKDTRSAPKENGQPSSPIKRPPPPQKMDSVDKRAPPPPPQPAKSPIPPPPPAPPAPPPPPPAPHGMPGMEPIVRKPLSDKQRNKLDALRNRPRRRPDYGNLMKEIEGGAKLKKVQCNDRSSPLLPDVKAKGQFLYESESPNVHNQLLKQIETGVKLKKVKTNDRSKPVLDVKSFNKMKWETGSMPNCSKIITGFGLEKFRTKDTTVKLCMFMPTNPYRVLVNSCVNFLHLGLRKFRRQMTIEEQMQKAEKEEPLEAEPLDDLDDIDRVRDDLQSTKQMLALELRNKEALERDNKRLLARLANLEAELEAARKAPPVATANAGTAAPAAEDKLVRQLKEEATEQQKMAKEMEKRYHTTAEELDTTKAKLEEAILQKKQMEKQLRELEDGLIAGKIIRQPSKRLISSKSGDIRKQASMARVGTNADMGNVPEDSSSEYTEETVTESEDEEEEDGDDAAAQERRVARELKLLTTKLRALKDKEQLARNEKRALRYQERNQQRALKAEKKKYKALQKEVDKMAKLMKEEDDDEEEDEEESESEESETESSEGEEESSSEEEPPSGDDLPDDAPPDDKKKNLTDRSKRHENILSALKKGNYLLKANIDRLKDDLNKHREMSLTLQEDLNSVLAELG